ncbi:sortase [Arthrobacter sp. MI7-26]|uniref:class F sortase n=1 Tax=Arthrobacter sp. MI7-26 TaxID=2993653 RepID=UPI002248DC36|nr:class F sortase [Arthrobacter sp. MI7-26]MCX2750082.1 sortase [Arthrobacter sp. MI7-26]
MTETAPGPRRPNTKLLSGAALVTAGLAILFSLLAGPASPQSGSGPSPVAAPFSPTDAPTTAKPAAPAQQGSPPLHITYPGVGMDQDVLPLTPAQGTQASIVPPMTVDAYWLTPYGSPGSTDTTYIVGHSWEGRDSAFNHLSTVAHPGDHLTLTTAAGQENYTVKTVSTENKNTLKDSPIWDKVPNRLVLVSCYAADLWGTNIIITADQTPTPTR